MEVDVDVNKVKLYVNTLPLFPEANFHGVPLTQFNKDELIRIVCKLRDNQAMTFIGNTELTPFDPVEPDIQDDWDTDNTQPGPTLLKPKRIE